MRVTANGVYCGVVERINCGGGGFASVKRMNEYDYEKRAYEFRIEGYHGETTSG